MEQGTWVVGEEKLVLWWSLLAKKLSFAWDLANYIRIYIYRIIIQVRIKWLGESASKRARFTAASSLLCFIQSIFLAFFFVIRFIFFLYLLFFSIVHFIFFFFFLKALDTEAYQVGLWAGEGNHGAVKSPCTYCRRSLLNTRCVDPIAWVRPDFRPRPRRRARGNNIENRF